jgi:hypothetical protein
MNPRLAFASAALGLCALSGSHDSTVAADTVDEVRITQSGAQRNSASGCKVTAPDNALDETNDAFKSYASRLVSHLRTETGETQEGILFTVERGGCEEFMETYHLIFPTVEQPATDVRYWMQKASDALEKIGRKAKHSALAVRRRYLSQFLQSRAPAENLVSFGPEADSVQFVLMENPPGKVSVRLVMADPR